MICLFGSFASFLARCLDPPNLLPHFFATSSLERDFRRRRLARQKGLEDDLSAQRPEIGDHHTREMAAKTAIPLAGCQARVWDPLIIAETAVRSDRVVVVFPKRKSLVGMGERAEQRLVQQLVSQATVEALDERILGAACPGQCSAARLADPATSAASPCWSARCRCRKRPSLDDRGPRSRCRAPAPPAGTRLTHNNFFSFCPELGMRPEWGPQRSGSVRLS